MEPTEHFGIYFGYIRRLFQSWVSPFNFKDDWFESREGSVFVTEPRRKICFALFLRRLGNSAKLPVLSVYLPYMTISSNETYHAPVSGADPGGGYWGARPPLWRSFIIQKAVFNSIQAPVHHWAPTTGRNPVSAPGYCRDNVTIIELQSNSARFYGI